MGFVAAHGKRDASSRQLIDSALVSIRKQAVERGAVDKYNAAVDAANDGNYELAIATLEPLIQTTNQPRLQRAAKELLGQITAAQNRQEVADLMNEAFDLAKEGKVEEAIAILERILAAGPEADTERDVRQILDSLRAVSNGG